MRGALLAIALVTAFSASAAIYRCTDAFGANVSRQEQPCTTAAGEAVAIPTQFPDHTGPRDGFAERERSQSVDARVLAYAGPVFARPVQRVRVRPHADLVH